MQLNERRKQRSPDPTTIYTLALHIFGLSDLRQMTHEWNILYIVFISLYRIEVASAFSVQIYKRCNTSFLCETYNAVFSKLYCSLNILFNQE